MEFSCSRAIPTVGHTDSTRSTGSKKEKKASAAPRFTIYKVNKASRKKREKSSAKKERKATKTLAIVLGEFHSLLHLSICIFNETSYSGKFLSPVDIVFELSLY